MKVAFIVQRYGEGVDGGSETLCREIAERLSTEVELEVLTSTAVDYLTWKNELRAGLEEVRGVRVRRFPVTAPRRVRAFGRRSERLYRSPHTIEDEMDWMIRQGPRVPSLVDFLDRSREEFDAFVFFTYLYYPTFFGLPLVSERSVLVPTLHDEPPAKFSIFRGLFHLPRAFVWNTPEERELGEGRFGPLAEGRIGGLGIEIPVEGDPEAFRRARGLGEYVLYLGRIDVSKGVPDLLEGFARYRRERAPDLRLVLAGSLRMKLPRDPGILPVGFLSEDEKREALAGASAIMMPSAFESLSVVCLEAWAAGRPVVASARSTAVAGQCARSGGGVTYRDDRELGEALDRARSEEGRAFGEAGRRYVGRECTWERVLDSYRWAAAKAARSVG